MTSQSNIYAATDLVNHYHEQGLNGEIRIYFKKNEVKAHNSKLDKPYYIIKPLVVKVGDIFDDAPKYSVFLKPKHWYRINLIDNNFWLLIINDKEDSFVNEQGLDVNFYDVTLKYISNSKLIDIICKKALAIRNIEEFNDTEI